VSLDTISIFLRNIHVFTLFRLQLNDGATMASSFRLLSVVMSSTNMTVSVFRRQLSFIIEEAPKRFIGITTKTDEKMVNPAMLLRSTKSSNNKAPCNIREDPCDESAHWINTVNALTNKQEQTRANKNHNREIMKLMHQKGKQSILP
jgi:hypothetical protein